MKMLSKNMGRIVSVGVVGVALLALGLLGAGAAFADEEESDCSGGRCRGPGSGRLLSMAAELELDEDQTARLTTVRELVREQRQERRRGAGFEILSDALETGELDPDAVHARIDERMDAKRATAHSVADELIALFDSLDEEQRVAMAAQMEDRQSQRSERRARRGHCRGNGDGDSPCGCGRGGRGGRGGPPADDSDDE